MHSVVTMIVLVLQPIACTRMPERALKIQVEAWRSGVWSC